MFSPNQERDDKPWHYCQGIRATLNQIHVSGVQVVLMGNSGCSVTGRVSALEQAVIQGCYSLSSNATRSETRSKESLENGNMKKGTQHLYSNLFPS